MTLDPVLNSTIFIQVHVIAALLAVILGAVNLTRKKGTRLHKIVGYAWAGLMAVIALSSYFIHEIQQWGMWSWIHILSTFTLVMLVFAVVMARRGHIQAHRFTMISLYVFALIVTGLFTLMPGRIMHSVVFG